MSQPFWSNMLGVGAPHSARRPGEAVAQAAGAMQHPPTAGGWEEVPHTGLYMLRRCEHACFVQHLVAGETARLPDGAPWELHLAGSSMFVASAAGQTLWCTSLIRTCLWKKGGRVLLYAKGLLANGGDLSEWLDELADRREVLRVCVQAPAGQGRFADIDMKVYRLSLPLPGASILWEVKRLAEFVAVRISDKSA